MGFAIRNALLGSIMPLSNGSERILKFQTVRGFASLFSIYAPMLNSALKEKDKFYENLEAAINYVPEQHLFYILGNFNARVSNDSTFWSVYLGQYGISKLNENEIEISRVLHCTPPLCHKHLLMCQVHSLCIFEAP